MLLQLLISSAMVSVLIFQRQNYADSGTLPLHQFPEEYLTILCLGQSWQLSVLGLEVANRAGPIILDRAGMAQ